MSTIKTAGVARVSSGTSLRARACEAATTNPTGTDTASSSTRASCNADGMRRVSMKYAYDQSASNAKKYDPMGANTTVAKSVTITSDREPMPALVPCDRASSSRAHHANAIPRANPMSGASGAGKGQELYLNLMSGGNVADGLAKGAMPKPGVDTPFCLR